MSRNYGLNTRNMAQAGGKALDRAAREKTLSFSSAATYKTQFSLFVTYAKSNGVGKMERITRELVQTYGKGLAEKVEKGEMKPSTAQNYISAINTTLTAASRGEWRSVSPTKFCMIQEKTAIRTENTIGQSLGRNSVIELQEKGLHRQASIAELALTLGLRSKEACLLNAKAALQQAKTSKSLTISCGTKGGRVRSVDITSKAQIDALSRAENVQGNGRSLMPLSQNWKEFREKGLREGREELKAAGVPGYHELRAEYAANRYEAITGHSAPCNSGKIESHNLDFIARLQISKELGHNRIEVVTEYVGGR